MISEMHEVTPDFLQLLISGGETIDVEFKGEEHVALSDHQLIGALVCLANRLSSKSGWLLIGVEDDGRITGARPRHNNRTDINKLSALLVQAMAFLYVLFKSQRQRLDLHLIN
jgi:ATP-dependent DNA helicase RecG